MSTMLAINKIGKMMPAKAAARADPGGSDLILDSFLHA